MNIQKEQLNKNCRVLQSFGFVFFLHRKISEKVIQNCSTPPSHSATNFQHKFPAAGNKSHRLFLRSRDRLILEKHSNMDVVNYVTA